MKFVKKKIWSAIIFTFGVYISGAFAQNFKIVLDAGHGGHDFGSSRGDYIEKHIVLDVTLRVGKLLEKEKGIEVVYTRKDDRFIELRERNNIANREKADAFVSIHANSHSKSSPYGVETYVMGLSKNKMNLDVAKRENDVIVLEKDYKKTYAGYNPNDPTSLLGLTLMQEQYLSQSIALAGKVQMKITGTLNRYNRGVKQAGFLVLHEAFMPSILIEIGFLSNPEEGAFINSDEGKDGLAKAISTAIIDYKRQFYDNNLESSSNTEKAEAQQPVSTSKRIVLEEEEAKKKAKEQTEVKAKVSSIELKEKEKETQKGVVFKVQLAASSKKTSTASKYFKGLSDVTVEKEGTLYKYYYKETKDIDYARKALEVAKDKGYRDAFIVPFKNGVKTTLNKINL